MQPRAAIDPRATQQPVAVPYLAHARTLPNIPKTIVKREWRMASKRWCSMPTGEKLFAARYGGFSGRVR